MQDVLRTGNENAGTASLTPDPFITIPGRAVVVVARHELAFVDQQFAVEQMQFFYARMSVRRVACARRKPYQHAYPMSFRVTREQLAFDPGRNPFPFRVKPPLAPRLNR